MTVSLVGEEFVIFPYTYYVTVSVNKTRTVTDSDGNTRTENYTDYVKEPRIGWKNGSNLIVN